MYMTRATTLAKQRPRRDGHWVRFVSGAVLETAETHVSESKTRFCVGFDWVRFATVRRNAPPCAIGFELRIRKAPTDISRHFATFTVTRIAPPIPSSSRSAN
jgi:hypothetical protein